MTLNLAKCNFAKPELTFVGCVIGSGHHSPDPVKVSVVASMKRVTTKKRFVKCRFFFLFQDLY